MTSTPTRPEDNVVITTKGLQDRNIYIIDGTTVENKGKLILTELMCKLLQAEKFLPDCGKGLRQVKCKCFHLIIGSRGGL